MADRIVIQFTPMVLIAATPVAPDETITCAKNSANNAVTPVVTESGSPIQADSLTILSEPVNGTAAAVGQRLLYTPFPGFVGTDQFTYMATVGGSDSNEAHVQVNVLERCNELGRTSRTYVTGYSLSKVNVCRVRRQAKRCVVANFNGALDPERRIVSVRWETTSPWSTFMSNARIAFGQRETMVDVSFNFSGWAGILATATLDNGEIYNAEFSFTVLDTPLYPSATYPLGQGPFRLDASI